MKHTPIVVLSSLALIILFAFQNCGQNGAITLEPGQPLAKSTDTMVVSPNNTDNEEPAAAAEEEEDKDRPDRESHSDQDRNDDKESHSDHAKKSCNNMEIADFLLKVLSVHSNADGGKSSNAIALEEVDAAISMNKLHITIRAIKDIKVKNLFMVLKSAGNKVLDMEDVAHDLKTPSGQTAGIKVHLDSEASLKAGEIYSLQFSIKQEDQIISNPVKCLFRPVIKSARIVEALVESL